MSWPRGGRFLTFEGLDGSGKSTQLEKLAEALRREGLRVTTTREPGGTRVGEQIRQLLLDSKSRLQPMAELALMFASRVQHIEEVIRPALARGEYVLCDRFTDSSEAYQGAGRGLGSETVRALESILCPNVTPDLTILMDTDPAPSVARARRRNTASDEAFDENRFEQEGRAFFERVRGQFLEIARREPERVLLVDARRPIEIVRREILEGVRERLQGRRVAG